MSCAKGPLDPTFRFTKILERTIDALDSALKEVKQSYRDVYLLFNYFQQIQGVLGEEKSIQEEKTDHLNSIYEAILTEANERDPKILLENVNPFYQARRDQHQKSWVNGVDCVILTFLGCSNIACFPNQSGQTWNWKECSAKKNKPF